MTTGIQKPGSISILVWLWTSFLPIVLGNYRYLGSYYIYGSGDTYITTYQNHGGSKSGNRRWIIECLDGEAAVGLQDYAMDFERVEALQCRFMFPHKTPSKGVYPYYQSCFVRDYRSNFFCFDAKNFSTSINTLVTGLFDDDLNWFTWRTGFDVSQPYKCCTIPKGYYIDYVSCYYKPTHDQYWEFYDAVNYNLVQCVTGYVVTGIAAKVNPWTKLTVPDWIQCCRVGFGTPRAISSPVAYSKSGTPVYIAQQVAPAISQQYHHQYQSPQKTNCSEAGSTSANKKPCFWSARYAPAKLRNYEHLSAV